MPWKCTLLVCSPISKKTCKLHASHCTVHVAGHLVLLPSKHELLSRISNPAYWTAILCIL